MKRAVAGLAGAALVLAFGVSCKKEQKSSPKYWAKRLNGSGWEQAIPNLVRMAGDAHTQCDTQTINEGGKSREAPLGAKEKAACQKRVDRAKQAVQVGLKPLLDLYERNPHPTILNALVGVFFDPQVVPALEKTMNELTATDSTKIDTALIAARMLHTLGVKGAPSAEASLLKVAKMKTELTTALSPDGVRRNTINDVRNEAILALGKFPSEKSTDALAELVEQSPTEINVALQGAACEALAEHPDVTRVVPTVIKGLFRVYVFERGPIEAYDQCRLAVTRAGAAATDALIELLQEHNKALNEMAKAEGWKENSDGMGLMVVRAAILIADLHAKKAAPMLRAQLAKEAAAKDIETLRKNAYLGLMNTMAILSDRDAGKDILKLVMSSKFGGMRHLAAFHYGRLGVRAGVADLLKLALTSAAAADSYDELRSEAAVAVGKIATGADKAAIEAAAAKLKADDQIKEVLQVSAQRAAVAADCGDKPACYAGKITDPNLAVAEKAILELGWMGEKAKEALPALLAALIEGKTDSMGILVALPEIAPGACAECITALDTLIQKRESASAKVGELRELQVVRNFYLSKQ